MHPDEVPTDVALVRRLVATQFPQWTDRAVAPIPSSGTDNAMYRLGDDLAVRLPRVEGAAPDVAREGRWLPRLAPALPVAVPEPVAQGRPGSGYPFPWAVHRWLDGENPVAGSVAEPERLAADLAGFVAALRRVSPAGGPAGGRGVPLSTRDEPTRAAIAALTGRVDTAAVTAVWEAALRLPEWPGPPAWAHADLSPGNVLVTGGRLTGVIDFAVAGVGDPTVDLIVAWNLLPATARPTFRAALDVDDDSWLRGRGWALSISLIQLPYYWDTNPVLAANSRHVITEVLADAR